MGISFNNNDYGITRKEWRAIKKELKAADKADDSFKLSRSDYKDMKASIKAGNLCDYLDKYGTNIRNAMGLSLTGKVDGTEDVKAAQQIVNDVELPKTDKAKVVRYIQMANYAQVKEGAEVAFKEVGNTMTTGHMESFFSQNQGVLDTLFA